MPQPLVALFSPDRDFASQLQDRLSEQFQFITGDSIDTVQQVLKTTAPAYLVADFRQAQGGGHLEDGLLQKVQDQTPETRIVMITAADCPEPLARRAACTEIDHLYDDVSVDDIISQLTAPAAGRNGQPADPDGPGPSGDDDDTTAAVLDGITRRFETNSPKLRRMLSDLEVAAKHNVTILLIGETGAGKTYLSKLIHEVSPRRDEPFLHVACGALPAELIESELFGHVKGAFTSAHADKEGKFLAAGRGTILLDEIDVLGPEQQVKLLKVIETGEFEPVGSNTTHTSQARLVVASNLDLQPLVDQAKFRPDLYYRLNMLKFEITPLRERKQDIMPLARMFVEKLSKKHDIEIQRIDDSFFDTLFTYPWPGNVRELENVVQRAVIFSRDGVLTADHLPGHIVAGTAGPANDPSVQLDHRVDQATLGRQVATTEKDIIEQALFKNNFSRTNTAKELGISRVTLYNKMKKYGMNKK